MGEGRAGEPPARPADVSGGLDRRGFMIAGAAAVTAGVIVAQAPVAFAAKVARSATALTPAPLTRAQFLPLVGKTFRIAGTTSRLTLVEVDDIAGAAAGSDSQFSLLFKGAGPVLDSATATLKGQGPIVSLFVSPVDRGVVQQHYQAIVNRID